MALKRILKDVGLYDSDNIWKQQLDKVKLYNLKFETDKTRVGVGEIEHATGFEQPKIEFTFKGRDEKGYHLIATNDVSGKGIRLVTAEQDIDGKSATVEIEARGRAFDVDRGDNERGKAAEQKITFNCMYVRETVNGNVVFEYDAINNILIIDGVDLMAETNAILA